MNQKPLVILLVIVVAGLSNLKVECNSNRALAIESTKVSKSVRVNKTLNVGRIPRKKQIKVAIIDTGIAPYVKEQLGCDSGHKDFTGFGLDDHHGHGTHISGLIYLNSGRLNKDQYCQIYLKFFDPSFKIKQNNIDNMVSALKTALQLKVDIVNISAGGNEFNKDERDMIVKLLDSGIIIVAAAGNEGNDISNGKGVRYYPASYDSRIIVVGNRESLNERAPSSNYGSNVVNWEKGVDVVSFGLIKDTWMKMSGTSQATAIKTGKILREMATGASF